MGAAFGASVGAGVGAGRVVAGPRTGPAVGALARGPDGCAELGAADEVPRCEVVGAPLVGGWLVGTDDVVGAVDAVGVVDLVGVVDVGFVDVGGAVVPPGAGVLGAGLAGAAGSVARGRTGVAGAGGADGLPVWAGAESLALSAALPGALSGDVVACGRDGTGSVTRGGIGSGTGVVVVALARGVAAEGRGVPLDGRATGGPVRVMVRPSSVSEPSTETSLGPADGDFVEVAGSVGCRLVEWGRAGAVVAEALAGTLVSVDSGERVGTEAVGVVGVGAAQVLDVGPGVRVDERVPLGSAGVVQDGWPGRAVPRVVGSAGVVQDGWPGRAVPRVVGWAAELGSDVGQRGGSVTAGEWGAAESPAGRPVAEGSVGGNGTGASAGLVATGALGEVGRKAPGAAAAVPGPASTTIRTGVSARAGTRMTVAGSGALGTRVAGAAGRTDAPEAVPLGSAGVVHGCAGAGRAVVASLGAVRTDAGPVGSGWSGRCPGGGGAEVVTWAVGVTPGGVAWAGTLVAGGAGARVGAGVGAGAGTYGVGGAVVSTGIRPSGVAVAGAGYGSCSRLAGSVTVPSGVLGRSA
ncbi:MAG: hypothetical protein IPK37_12065 [Austwickia sp.]|nr:MAG: hypothetical protein IPK37_12065 [Austwickia sp.]